MDGEREIKTERDVSNVPLSERRKEGSYWLKATPLGGP